MTRIHTILLGLLLPTTVLAQDIVGEYELEGRLSSQRRVAVGLKVTVNTSGDLCVERSGRYTSARSAHLPPVFWRSSQAHVEGQLLVVTYVVEPAARSAGADGLADLVSSAGSASEVSSALLASEDRRYKAAYIVSQDGSIREYVTNVTRAAEDNWRWIYCQGSRSATAARPPARAVRRRFERGFLRDDLERIPSAELAGLPTAVKESRDYYYQNVEQEDWGTVRVYRERLHGADIYIVHTTTDGDDGYLELFYADGTPIASGRSYYDIIEVDGEDVMGYYAGGGDWDEEFGDVRRDVDY